MLSCPAGCTNGGGQLPPAEAAPAGLGPAGDDDDAGDGGGGAGRRLGPAAALLRRVEAAYAAAPPLAARPPAPLPVADGNGSAADRDSLTRTWFRERERPLSEMLEEW